MPTTEHPALAQAPKTKLEAGQRLLKLFKDGKLQPPGECRYLDVKSGQPCAIGSFFTPDQLKWIKAKDLNHLSVHGLMNGSGHSGIGEKNLEAMTGLTYNKCVEIQNAFDSRNAQKFYDAVEKYTGAKL